MSVMAISRLAAEGVIKNGTELNVSDLRDYTIEFSALCHEIASEFKNARVDLIVETDNTTTVAVSQLVADHLVKIKRHQLPKPYLPHRAFGNSTLPALLGKSEKGKQKVLVVTDELDPKAEPSLKEIVNAIEARGAQVVGVGALFSRINPKELGLGEKVPVFVALDLSENT